MKKFTISVSHALTCLLFLSLLAACNTDQEKIMPDKKNTALEKSSKISAVPHITEVRYIYKGETLTARIEEAADSLRLLEGNDNKRIKAILDLPEVATYVRSSDENTIYLFDNLAAQQAYLNALPPSAPSSNTDANARIASIEEISVYQHFSWQGIYWDLSYYGTYNSTDGWWGIPSLTPYGIQDEISSWVLSRGSQNLTIIFYETDNYTDRTMTYSLDAAVPYDSKHDLTWLKFGGIFGKSHNWNDRISAIKYKRG